MSEFNTRLWQKILQCPDRPHGIKKLDDILSQCKEVVRNGNVITLDNVVSLCEGKRLDPNRSTSSQFPNMYPFLTPGFYEYIIRGPRGYEASGMMIGEIPKETIDRHVRLSDSRIPASGIYGVLFIYSSRSDTLIVYPAIVQCYYDEDKQFSGMVLSNLLEKGLTKEDPTDEKGKDRLINECYPIFLSWSLAQCKNVEIKKTPSETDPKRIEKLRRHGIPRITIKTLDIEPFRTVVKNETEGGESGIKKALHICRGHFRSYDPETSKGLFGRGQYGTFWVPQHERGSAKEGVVEKDYRILPPKEEETDGLP